MLFSSIYTLANFDILNSSLVGANGALGFSLDTPSTHQIRSSSIALPILTLTSFLVGWGLFWIKSSRQTSLPPGPPSDPILGHLRVIPTKNQAEIFHSWAKLYGPYSSFFFFRRDSLYRRGCNPAPGTWKFNSCVRQCQSCQRLAGQVWCKL